MPDTRTHRGAHPEDAVLFGMSERPKLRRATADLCWLLDRRYAPRSALVLVGDRYALTQRQRIAVARCACATADAAGRHARERTWDSLRDSEVWIDGYNLLITVEAALAGGVILHGRDGCFRDLASLHGTYRRVEETEPAITLIGEELQTSGTRIIRWVLDRPVSNSGRLRDRLLAIAEEKGWPWQVDLEFSPDAVLARCDAIVGTSDSVVLDRCRSWTNLARTIVSRRVPSPFLVDLSVEETEATEKLEF